MSYPRTTRRWRNDPRMSMYLIDVRSQGEQDSLDVMYRRMDKYWRDRRWGTLSPSGHRPQRQHQQRKHRRH